MTCDYGNCPYSRKFISHFGKFIGCGYHTPHPRKKYHHFKSVSTIKRYAVRRKLEAHRKTVVPRVGTGKVMTSGPTGGPHGVLQHGYLNVYLYKVADPIVGLDMHELSPTNLGPVEHNVPGVFEAKTLHVYMHYAWYVYGCDVDDPMMYTFCQRQRAYLTGYHVSTSVRTGCLSDSGKYVPCATMFWTLNGKCRLFDGIQSRYFFCHHYVKLVKSHPCFLQLCMKHKLGWDLNLITRMGKDVPLNAYSAYVNYTDLNVEFDHGTIIYCMLTMKENEYPWIRYRQAHPTLYADMFT